MEKAERDWLVTLRKAAKRLITQREAAEELGVSIRQVKRLLYALKKKGDRAVIHGLKGQLSNRRMEAGGERQAVEISSAQVYEGFGPTLASEYLRDQGLRKVPGSGIPFWKSICESKSGVEVKQHPFHFR